MVGMQMKDLIATNIDGWRRMVLDAGGIWVGVQQSFAPTADAEATPEPYVLFRCPSNAGPMALPVSQMTLANVKAKLGIETQEDEELYFIEVDNNGCPHCGNDRTWVVVGPDGYGGGISYGTADEAAKVAETLNDAFARGRKSKRR